MEAVDKPRNIQFKGETDLVTETDKASEEAILKVGALPPVPVPLVSSFFRPLSPAAPVLHCDSVAHACPAAPSVQYNRALTTVQAVQTQNSIPCGAFGVQFGTKLFPEINVGF